MVVDKFRPTEYACIFSPNIVRQRNSVIRGMNILLINIPSEWVKNVNRLLFRQTGDFFNDKWVPNYSATAIFDGKFIYFFFNEKKNAIINFTKMPGSGLWNHRYIISV